ncbi:MAG: hypothetical protein ACRC8D_07240 [Aeromonas sp.]
MEIKTGKGIDPALVEKAREALKVARASPIVTSKGALSVINVGYRHRLLIRVNGTATLLTHEQTNAFYGRKGRN